MSSRPNPVVTLISRIARPISPAAFIKRGTTAKSGTVVVCAGDSITHGLMSANYVEMLRDRLAPDGYEFVNAGISGDLAWNLAQRLDDVIACRPDVVTILVGTNDTAARIGADWLDGYMRQQRLPRRPDLDWYREQLVGIVRRLQHETDARLALLTIPPLGEDLDSRYNALVADTNAVIQKVGEEHGVPVLPLHDRLVAELEGRPDAAPRFDATKRLMMVAIVNRWLLRRPYRSISDRIGRRLLIDDVHLNERAASVVADVIQRFVRGAEDHG